MAQVVRIDLRGLAEVLTGFLDAILHGQRFGQLSQIEGVLRFQLDGPAQLLLGCHQITGLGQLHPFPGVLLRRECLILSRRDDFTEKGGQTNEKEDPHPSGAIYPLRSEVERTDAHSKTGQARPRFLFYSGQGEGKRKGSRPSGCPSYTQKRNCL